MLNINRLNQHALPYEPTSFESIKNSVENSRSPDLMINEFLELNEKISRYSFNSSLTLRSHSNARVFF